MPKFTLIKHREFETDAEVSVTFSTDELGTANDHFDDFLKASGFEVPLEKAQSEYVVRPISEWEWDDNGELKADESTYRDALIEHSDFSPNVFMSDIIEFPKHFNNND